MSFQWISQEKLIWDWDLNPREKDESHIRAIAAHMNEHGYDPKHPVSLYEFEGAEDIDGYYRAATGLHRLEASLLKDDEFPNLPLSEVYVEIIVGTRAEYVRRMLIDNFQHLPGFNQSVGKMPDRFEIKAMRSRLLFFPDVFLQGDRLLAKNWGCDRDTVSKLREEFISAVNNPNEFVDESSFHAKGDFEKIQKIIEDDLYTGIDGKKYPRTTKPVEPTKPDPEPVEETPAEELDAIDLLIKDVWSERTLWIERHKGKRIDYVQPFMLVEAARREMQELWDYDDETPHCSTELKGDATLEELTYVLECMKENNNPFIDAVQFVMFGDEDEKESEEVPAENDKVIRLGALREDFKDLFTLHGEIPIYGAECTDGESIASKLASKHNIPSAEVYCERGNFKTYLETLKKDVRKQLKKNPDIQAKSLAADFQEDVEVIKTILANIEKSDEFAKQNSPSQPVEETPAYVDAIEVVEKDNLYSYKINLMGYKDGIWNKQFTGEIVRPDMEMSEESANSLLEVLTQMLTDNLKQ